MGLQNFTYPDELSIVLSYTYLTLLTVTSFCYLRNDFKLPSLELA